MLREIFVVTQDINLETLCEPLRLNPNFHWFTNIDDALSQLAKVHEPVAMFVDVEWPKEQNGYNVAREVKKRRDRSKTFLLTDHIKDVHLHWSKKLDAEMVERTETSFLTKLVPFANTAGAPIAGDWHGYLQKQDPKTLTSVVERVESELERILGPMGPLLLHDAMATAHSNLQAALREVAAFGTTVSERSQVEDLSKQLAGQDIA